MDFPLRHSPSLCASASRPDFLHSQGSRKLLCCRASPLMPCDCKGISRSGVDPTLNPSRRQRGYSSATGWAALSLPRCVNRTDFRAEKFPCRVPRNGASKAPCRRPERGARKIGVPVRDTRPTAVESRRSFSCLRDSMFIRPEKSHPRGALSTIARESVPEVGFLTRRSREGGEFRRGK